MFARQDAAKISLLLWWLRVGNGREHPLCCSPRAGKWRGGAKIAILQVLCWRVRRATPVEGTLDSLTGGTWPT